MCPVCTSYSFLISAQYLCSPVSSCSFSCSLLLIPPDKWWVSLYAAWVRERRRGKPRSTNNSVCLCVCEYVSVCVRLISKLTAEYFKYRFLLSQDLSWKLVLRAPVPSREAVPKPCFCHICLFQHRASFHSRQSCSWDPCVKCSQGWGFPVPPGVWSEAKVPM